MAKAVVVLAEGFEEIEGVSVVDVLRRGGVQVTMVSMGEGLTVTGARGIAVAADALFENLGHEGFDALILPGGGVVEGYKAHEGLCRLVKSFYSSGRLIGAICAAPLFLASLGILEGRKAVCFPGLEEGMAGSLPGEGNVVCDNNIITSKSAATAIHFALAVLSRLCGNKTAQEVAGNLHMALIDGRKNDSKAFD